MDKISFAWRGENDSARIDQAVISLEHNGMYAHGTSVAGSYALAWHLDATDEWRTRTLEVSAYGRGWSRSLALRRSGEGAWSADTCMRGVADLAEAGLPDASTVQGALDCDLGLCPVTNTMPIRRLRLLDADVPESPLVMAWVDVPSLRVIRSDQVYSSAGPGRVRYRSFSRDFHAELTVDDYGVVVDYPGLSQRITSR